MGNYLVVPDSFKGTLSAQEVCALMKKGILAADPSAAITTIPVADGGEGTVDAMIEAIGGERVPATVQGPYGEMVQSFYGRLKHGLYVIEMAAAAGLPMVRQKPNPEATTTYGVGELIRSALEDGAKQIILGLGGSCTNDGGCGMAVALGARFLDKSGQAFIPTGGTLHEIASVDLEALMPQVRQADIRVMCDIDNPLCGKQGAAHVFALQKGADSAMAERLDAGLRHLASVVLRDLHVDILDMRGAGAAGGMGGGAVAFLGGTLQMGIETILDAVQFEKHLNDADLVLTGEGKFDEQSLRGKVVIGVSRRAKLAQVPVLAFAGSLTEDTSKAYAQGVTAAFSINRAPMAYEEAIRHSTFNLTATVEDAVRCFLAGRNPKER